MYVLLIVKSKNKQKYIVVILARTENRIARSNTHEHW